jgi:hypothetical protein
VWVVFGSIWFPLWWYQAIWRRELWDSDYFLSASFYLLNNEMTLLLGICVVLLLLVLSYRFWARFLVWVDRWAGHAHRSSLFTWFDWRCARALQDPALDGWRIRRSW